MRGAEQLARGLGYTTAILVSEVAHPEPTAFYPVGFPAVLSVVRMLGGGKRADLLLQAAFGILTIGLTFVLARAVANPRTARIAAWLVALSPGAILYTTTWLAEPAVALGILVALVPLLTARRATMTRALVAFGFVMGLTSFLRVTTLVITPLVAFGVGAARRRGAGATTRLRLGVVAAAIATASALVPIAPWCARNAVALGSPVLVSTNGGLNLLLGTIGEGGYRRIDPSLDCPEGSKELVVDACRKQLAIARIRRDPVAWIARGVGKVWHTFGHESAPAQHLGAAVDSIGGDGGRISDMTIGLTRAHWLVFVGFALVGIRELLRTRARRAHALLLGPLVGLAALHALFIGGDRYHAAVIPILAVLAALGWTAREREPRATPISS